MIQIFSKGYLPRRLDIIGLLMVGIVLQIMDGSPFTMKERWQLVWDTDLPSNHFTPFDQKLIKTILSVIVTVRCTSTYAYVVSAMLVIFCICKRTAPKLMCLWLLISIVKPIFMIVLEGLIGMFVCSAFGKIRKACMEFFIVKGLELIFSCYLWGNVLSIYKSIEQELEVKKIRREENLLSKKEDFRFLRARSLIDESTLSKTAHFNNFERRDVPLLILQMLKRDEEMSDDSLLAPGMMLTSVSNLGSFDNIKTSQSLGELGFTDLTNAEVFGIEDDDEHLSRQEKVLKFLKLTNSEVGNIIRNKSSVGNDIYNVGDDIWKRVMSSGVHVNQPKQPRTEIFLRTISPMDLDEESDNLNSRTKRSLPFRSIISLLLGEKKEKDLWEDDDDSHEMESQDEEEQVDNIFMSNLKDGGPINRIKMGPSLKKFKGTQYANLYKKDFMNVIGPEVFDKASKLPQLTSLTKIRAITARPPRSMPDLTKRKSRRLRTLEQRELSRSSHIYEHFKKSAFGSAWESLPNVSFQDSSEYVHHKDSKHMISFLIRKSEEEIAENSDAAAEIEAHEEDKMKVVHNENDEPTTLKPRDEEEVAPGNLENEAIPQKLQDKEPEEPKLAETQLFESKMSLQKFRRRKTLAKKFSDRKSSIRIFGEPKSAVRKITEPKVVEENVPEARVLQEKSVEPRVVQENLPEPRVLQEKSAEPRVVQENLPEPRVLQEKSAEPRMVQENLPEPRVLQEKSAEPKVVEAKSAEPKVVQEKSAESKVVHEKSAESKVVHEKSAESKVVHEKSAESKAKQKSGDSKLKIKKPSKLTHTSGPNEEELTRAKEPSSAHLPEPENPEKTKPDNTYKNRKIMIRWVGQRKSKSLLLNQTTGNRSPFNDSDSLTDLPQKSAPQTNKEDSEKHQSSEKYFISKRDDSAGVKKKKFKTDTKQIYYVSELFGKPLFDVLLNYYDLKKKVYLKGYVKHQKKEKMDFPKIKPGKNHLRETEKVLRSLGLEMKSGKNWKSEVLKRSEPGSQIFRTTSVTFLNILNKKAAIRKLLLREYKHLMQKYNSLNEAKTEDFGFTSPETDHSEDSDISSGTESDINTTDSAESWFVEGFPSGQPEEPKSDAPSPVLSELQPSDRLDAEEGDIQTSTTDATKPQMGPRPESRAFHALANEEGELLSSQESDEPISLYYSKAADLASPLLDMKGFIYPDHIHYSYKHVKKKGFDVDINGGFPLLMRGSLTKGHNRVKVEHKWEAKNRGCEIKRRPMDLSFAKTNAFAEWHSADQNDLDSITSETTLAAENYDSATEINSAMDLVQKIKVKRENDSVERRDNQHTTENDFKKAKPKSHQQNFSDLNYLYQSKDAALIEKLLKMHKKLNEEEYRRGKKNQPSVSNQQTPVQISSTQLHSNKGQMSSTHSTSTVLEENKTSNEEKKKSETQKERNKVMFARSDKAALLQKRVVLKPFCRTRKL